MRTRFWIFFNAFTQMYSTRVSNIKDWNFVRSPSSQAVPCWHLTPLNIYTCHAIGNTEIRSHFMQYQAKCTTIPSGWSNRIDPIGNSRNGVARCNYIYFLCVWVWFYRRQFVAPLPRVLGSSRTRTTFNSSAKWSAMQFSFSALAIECAIWFIHCLSL